jgi:hypothetical protein
VVFAHEFHLLDLNDFELGSNAEGDEGQLLEEVRRVDGLHPQLVLVCLFVVVKFEIGHTEDRLYMMH